MKKYLFIISTILIGCKPLKNQITNNKKNMEKFNIQKYINKDLKINEIYKEKKNDSVVEITELEDSFTQNTRVINSPFQNRKVYFKTNLSLKTESNYFYMVPIGISKKYDENGNIIEQKNWDELEKRNFSIQQLIDKMSNDFNIDLSDESKCGLRTAYDPRFGYYYEIMIRNYDLQNKYRKIHINTTTGEIISDNIVGLKK